MNAVGANEQRAGVTVASRFSRYTIVILFNTSTRALTSSVIRGSALCRNEHVHQVGTVAW
jgi:hypothetical protein